MKTPKCYLIFFSSFISKNAYNFILTPIKKTLSFIFKEFFRIECSLKKTFDNKLNSIFYISSKLSTPLTLCWRRINQKIPLGTVDVRNNIQQFDTTSSVLCELISFIYPHLFYYEHFRYCFGNRRG